MDPLDRRARWRVRSRRAPAAIHAAKVRREAGPCWSTRFPTPRPPPDRAFGRARVGQRGREEPGQATAPRGVPAESAVAHGIRSPGRPAASTGRGGGVRGPARPGDRRARPGMAKADGQAGRRPGPSGGSDPRDAGCRASRRRSSAGTVASSRAVRSTPARRSRSRRCRGGLPDLGICRCRPERGRARSGPCRRIRQSRPTRPDCTADRPVRLDLDPVADPEESGRVHAGRPRPGSR